MTREEMEKKIIERVEKMNREELERFTVVLDRLSESSNTGEPLSVDEMREIYRNAIPQGAEA